MAAGKHQEHQHSRRSISCDPADGTASSQVNDVATPSLAPSPQPSASASSQSSVAPPPHPTGPPVGIPLAGPNAPNGAIIISNDDIQSDATGGSINGQTFSNAFVGDCGMACSEPETASLPLNLGRQYTLLKARFGIDDNSLSSTEPTTITVIADGSVIYSHAFTLGHSSDVTLNVSDVLRLTFPVLW
jgi:hypothetical protein